MELYKYDPKDLEVVAKHVESWLIKHGVSYLVVTADYAALNLFSVRVKPLRRTPDKFFNVLMIDGKPVIQ